MSAVAVCEHFDCLRLSIATAIHSIPSAAAARMPGVECAISLWRGAKWLCALEMDDEKERSFSAITYMWHTSTGNAVRKTLIHASCIHVSFTKNDCATAHTL
jgi:hypothetical protein